MTNVLDEDFGGTSSSEDDQDYIPSGGEAVSSESSDDAGEQEAVCLDDVESSGRHARRRKVKRKAKKTVEVVVSSTSADDAKDEESSKKRVEDLWSDFLADVSGSKSANIPAAIVQPQCSPDDVASNASVRSAQVASTSVPVKEQAAKSVLLPAKVSVTKLFDFAGEEVRVEKLVDADSIEAREAADRASVAVSAAADARSPHYVNSGSDSCGGPSVPVKRSGGLGSLVNMLSKKPKISTLDKSKLDWQTYKERHSISEELAQHNRGKDGFIERQEFLQRSDLRQFEVEKNVRQSQRKYQ